MTTIALLGLAFALHLLFTRVRRLHAQNQELTESMDNVKLKLASLESKLDVLNSGRN